MVRRAINTSDTAQDYPLDQEGFVFFAYGSSQGRWNGNIVTWLGLPHGLGKALGAYMQYVHTYDCMRVVRGDVYLSKGSLECVRCNAQCVSQQ